MKLMYVPLPKPADINAPNIIALCKSISEDSEPLYLDVELIASAIQNECYGNVERMITTNGGVIQYGWQVWETLPGVMAEAEFHAVWVDSEKRLHDITPKACPDINSILFLPDRVKKFQGRQIDNVRIPLCDDLLIREFIENSEQYFEESNRGGLADQFGYIPVTSRIQELLDRKRALEIEILQKYYF